MTGGAGGGESFQNLPQKIIQIPVLFAAVSFILAELFHSDVSKSCEIENVLKLLYLCGLYCIETLVPVWPISVDQKLKTKKLHDRRTKKSILLSLRRTVGVF